MSERDLQRWTREVADDPGAPSFVRLARAYRRQGRGRAARDVVLAGLGANPENVEGHALLALLHVEDGERQQAGDEWETVLRLDPGNFDASRGLGFLALERGELQAARRHLDAAARVRPDDPAVSQALKVLDRREQASAAGPAEGAGTGAEESRWSPGSATRAETGAAAGPAAGPAVGAVGTSGAAASDAPPASPGKAGGVDPLQLFAPLVSDAPFRGALVLDDQGMVLAGRLEEEDRQDDLLGALLTTAVAEARRATDMLELGEWGELLLETEEATLHVDALPGGAAVVVVAERGAPAGWVMRVAGRARALAEQFLKEER